MPLRFRAPLPLDPDPSAWRGLFEAIKAGDVAAMADALARGASPNAWDPRQGPALIQALSPLIPKARSLSLAKLLLTLGAHPDHGIFRPPLAFAVMDNRPDVFALLIEFGANPNARGALLDALADHSVVKSNPKIQPPEPILRWALPHPFWVRTLLDAGADPNAFVEGQALLLRAAIDNKVPLDSLELLLSAGANPAALNELGQDVVQACQALGRDESGAFIERFVLERSGMPCPPHARSPRL
jgi:hypothetical protein